MKKFVQSLLQRLLGFKNYLFVFAVYKSLTLKSDKKEGDFNYLITMLGKNSIVLDIGANIGIMTSNLAKKVKHVYAFEPMPDNVSTLKKVLNYFGLQNVTIYEFALGNEHKQIEMVMPVVSNVKMQGLSHVIDDSITEFNDGIRFRVDQKRIDDIEELKTKKIDAIKIDVENFEYQVFLGAKKLITQNKPVIYCELWDNENRYNCFSFFKDINYSIKVLSENQLVNFDRAKHNSQNFFFVAD